MKSAARLIPFLNIAFFENIFNQSIKPQQAELSSCFKNT